MVSEIDHGRMSCEGVEARQGLHWQARATNSKTSRPRLQHNSPSHMQTFKQSMLASPLFIFAIPTLYKESVTMEIRSTY